MKIISLLSLYDGEVGCDTYAVVLSAEVDVFIPHLVFLQWLLLVRYQQAAILLIFLPDKKRRTSFKYCKYSSVSLAVLGTSSSLASISLWF